MNIQRARSYVENLWLCEKKNEEELAPLSTRYPGSTYHVADTYEVATTAHYMVQRTESAIFHMPEDTPIPATEVKFLK